MTLQECLDRLVELAKDAGELAIDRASASDAEYIHGSHDALLQAVGLVGSVRSGELDHFTRGIVFALDALMDTHPDIANSELYRSTIKPDTPLFTGDNL